MDCFRGADADSQGRVPGLGDSAAKADALLSAATGGLTLAWLPLEFAFWPVAALYVLSAIGMRLIRMKGEAMALVERESIM